ncbi:MAG: M10 family metallopeptidase C-terminal domain-containing protein, partial [Thalassovita sp.]|nr:M10 family metallopeptidase C-terminal domain-containing protein [Thalassovita sp.]
ISTNWLSSPYTVDSYWLTTYIHEIGHALGLGHQGYYNGGATFGTDAIFANDSYQMSIMSYFSQTQNTNINASYALPATAMMADILAIQNLYGVSTVTAGNTVWGANSNLGNYLGTYFQGLATDSLSSDFYADGPMALTIYDQGGIDMLNLSFSTTNDRIDMNAESVSDIGGLTGNVGIARGTVLERLIAGSGNDAVTGNDADNRIWGRGGNDSIYGGSGEDTLKGGAGTDRLYGGDDKDKIYGGRGTDYADLGDGNDRFNDSRESGASGADTVVGGNGRDYIRLRGGDDIATGGAGRDVFIFKSGDIDADTITDYEIGTDSLRIDDKLWSGTLTADQVVSTYADLSGSDVIFDFGNGNMITLTGVGTLSGLADDLSIV